MAEVENKPVNRKLLKALAERDGCDPLSKVERLMAYAVQFGEPAQTLADLVEQEGQRVRRFLEGAINRTHPDGTPKFSESSRNRWQRELEILTALLDEAQPEEDNEKTAQALQR